ncbi:hypothetical protein F7725_019955 [Dissostichus mawsoni]|uniref:Uncharacterized protein n=1 Tax=Dissostichus mawsoni TaxID=36200 RepID=A0A7J5YL63_DISMA|nr:hypothetical protein F7725_019955 [Dissostichus mawsoni]
MEMKAEAWWCRLVPHFLAAASDAGGDGDAVVVILPQRDIERQSDGGGGRCEIRPPRSAGWMLRLKLQES